MTRCEFCEAECVVCENAGEVNGVLLCDACAGPVNAARAATVETKETAEQRAARIEAALPHFTGSQEYHRHWTRRLIWTEGVNWLAEQCGSYWLIDVIASYQGRAAVRGCGGLQIWTLELKSPGHVYGVKVQPGNTRGRVTCKADTNEPAVVTQLIPYTDFPLPRGIKLYVRDGVLMLPSEN
jgi:hypothetical protein